MSIHESFKWPGIAAAKTIDIHAHVVLEQSMGTAGRFGPEVGADEAGKPWFRIGDYYLHGVKYRGSPFMEVDLRLDRMIEAGIEFQVLSPNPLTYFHHIDRAEAIAFCRRHNDVLAELTTRYPHALGGLAALPMQDPDAACEELERSVWQLGLWGACVGTDFPGRALHHADYDALYRQFTSLDVPLFFHPAPAGIDGPPGDPNLKQFDLDIISGFSSQETLAVANLFFGGVLERHPTLDVCVSHGGGAIALLAGRVQQAALKRPWAPEWVRQEGSFDRFLRKLWLDTHLPDERSLAVLIDLVGTDRLVFGTNFAGWDQPAHIEVAEIDLLCAGNARRLLRQGS